VSEALARAAAKNASHFLTTGESRVQTAFRISQVLVLLVVIVGVNRLAGQEKPAALPHSLYPLPGYEEDWSFLSDPAKRDDFWDSIKFIPLNQDRNVFLSLGGEIRETYERFHNTNFGLATMTLTVIFCSAICFTSTL
jgi:hypothetical protein